MTYTLVSTLPGAAVCFMWKTLRRLSFTNWRLQELSTSLSTGVIDTENVCSKANPEEKACVQESSVLWSERNKLSVLSKEAKFPELQCSCGCALDNNKHILAIILQCHHILMQEPKNGVVPGEPEVHRLVLILHATASLKAVLPFDLVNTTGQKPSTLHAHFTYPYRTLDTLPNHYY